MLSPVIVLDVHNICYRNYYAMQSKLSNPAIYGCLRILSNLAEIFDSNSFAFCFDHPVYERRKLYPDYKPVYISCDRQAVLGEIEKLRTNILPSLGYNNLFQVEGAEADDLIAVLTKQMKPYDRHILVSTDKDLYQLLRGEAVKIWDHATKSTWTVERLMAWYRLSPPEWIRMKAIAGCVSDNISGVANVGTGRATSFIRGELPPQSKVRINIENNSRLTERNEMLVRLPYFGPDYADVSLLDGEPDPELWDEVMQEHGLGSLTGRCP